MGGFYLYSQNNSGGYYVQDKKIGIGNYLFIWGESCKEANEKAKSLGLFSLSFCECCGSRFSPLWEGSEPMKEGEKISFFSLSENIYIFLHHESGEIQEVIIPSYHWDDLQYVWMNNSPNILY